MKRVWKPLDVGRLRLYKVKQYFIWKDGTQETEQFAVLAKSPSGAAKLVQDIYSGYDWSSEITSVTYRGFPFDVLMPESWWQEGIPGTLQ